MIRLENVSVSFGKKQVLSRFNMEFFEGESVCILGKSGCGKSTLLKTASGLILPHEGNVYYSREIKKSFIFQENRLLPWLSALENITYIGVHKSKALEYLALVGLENESYSMPEGLSGGMKRRLAIARALAFGGDCFFFDEPLQGLDVSTGNDILNLIKRELKGKTALIITHNKNEALELAEKILITRGLAFEVVKCLSAGELENENELIC